MLNESHDYEEAGFDTTETFHFKVAEEARQLARKEYIPELIEYLDIEPDKNRRDRAYFILTQLAENTGDNSAIQALIDRTRLEKDKYVLSRLLDGIARLKKPSSINLSPVFDLMKRKEWLVRRSAIEALRYSEDPLAEDRRIEVLETSTDPDDIISANAMLNVIGSPKSIPYPTEHTLSRKRDVKLSAKLAIEEVLKRNP